MDAARSLLERHGRTPGRVLGAGMEGTVIELGPEEVAKVWQGRSRRDLEALRDFGAAVRGASIPFALPDVRQLLDELDEDALLITVERRLHGVPLRVDGDPEPPPVTPEETHRMADALAGLARVPSAPALAALPVLPGEEPLDPGVPFGVALAALVGRRVTGSRELLRRDVPEADDLIAGVVTALRDLPADSPTVLVHGDLIPANVLVDGGRVSGVLDFGFMTTLGDPAFDAAITASVFDMYGPHARRSEETLSAAFAQHFGHDTGRYALYRAAYALLTATVFSPAGDDGHFAWCVAMLRRADVRAAVLR